MKGKVQVFWICIQIAYLSCVLIVASPLSSGLFPSVFNLIESSIIKANATCGERNSEVFCRLDKHGYPSNIECNICDASEQNKAHSIIFVTDGRRDTWWQAPSLQFGPENHFVTITIDLKQIFQVDYILMQSGPSPRPATWILERSIDGVDWAPWQFFAGSDEECWREFGVEPRRGKPVYKYDDEVICTSYFSKLDPMEYGEIHLSMVNGRPGSSGPSRDLVEFTMARFVRIRFRRISILPADELLVNGFTNVNAPILRRYFYSLSDLTIGGHCPCNGHANECTINQSTMAYKCNCLHNTCGSKCNQCCPMFNQKVWRQGRFARSNECEKCECFGHADHCFFDPRVESDRLSVNTFGKLEGGGVCVGCRHHTTGINCQSCEKGYYRPVNVSHYDLQPCHPCKCDRLIGSTGDCHSNEEAELAYKNPGDCVCKVGFTGPKCQKCAKGYHDYPKCKPCPCSLEGTIDGACLGPCKCKKNVEGIRCDRCRRGFYALSKSHDKGCLSCFCSGVSEVCEDWQLGIDALHIMENWRVTDLQSRRIVDPYWSTVANGISIAEEDMQGTQTYFWMAPPQFLGNKLTSYGLNFNFATSWHTGRGDTAGTAITGPDIILEGNDLLIGFGAKQYKDNFNASIEVTFTENDWYQIPTTLLDIEAKSYNDGSVSFVGEKIQKSAFMKVLSNIKRMLVRCKYHSDQLEGTLNSISLEIGSAKKLGTRRTFISEKCKCPVGYTGSSCESCSYGYTKNAEGKCFKCDCNGHAVSCDPNTHVCGECEHSTFGVNCENCQLGYYGNALRGTPNDCKKCKCPLEAQSNNFSPTCILAWQANYDPFSYKSLEEYICTDCRKGYAGQHCERCDNGYFGNPLIIGGSCQPCDCNGNGNINAPNWCNHRTGECLKCLGNTEGWNCDKCLIGFYGNPLLGHCKACNCSAHGSESNICDSETGQCRCKERFVGRTCSQCRDGFGNVNAGCRLCSCNKKGSKSDVCDADTGQCHCLSGVSGERCDICQKDFFGFNSSFSGCQACHCHEIGALDSQCDEILGYCKCANYVAGEKCERCIDGFWNMKKNIGCEPCNCSQIGSEDQNCNQSSGQCNCKFGIGGDKCDRCKPGFWGFSSYGCKKCKKCEQPGHVCNPKNGTCGCPELTEGFHCEQCQKNAWLYHPYNGCQACNCHEKGSATKQCDFNTGICKCLEGFEGEKCNRCKFGHYNFPNCWPCNCDPNGTNMSECKGKLCSCDGEGTCKCKRYVEGKKCASCIPGTFGLSSDIQNGCTKCFCFGKSDSCWQANLYWGTVNSAARTVHLIRGNTALERTNGLLVIPQNESRSILAGIPRDFRQPLYWDLSEEFLGDKTTSYNGFIRFTTRNVGIGNQSTFSNSPLVQIQSENLVLEHYSNTLSNSGRYEIRLIPSLWKKRDDDSIIKRPELMECLFDIKRILVRATDLSHSSNATLESVSLDVGIAKKGPKDRRNIALGVETCDCPTAYSSHSCQNPGNGYFRLNKTLDVRNCECNGLTNKCNPNTGYCTECSNNTSGAFCDKCAPGFYGDPSEKCLPCQCPNERKNRASTCSLDAATKTFRCQCKVGYFGPTCERCDYGFFGNSEDGCIPCACNSLGSKSIDCDPDSGQCNCIEGVKGRNCSQCNENHVLTKEGKCKNCKNLCTSSLLESLNSLQKNLSKSTFSELDLAKPSNRIETLGHKISIFESEISVNEDIQRWMAEAQINISLLQPITDLSSLEVKSMAKKAFVEALKVDSFLNESSEIFKSSTHLLESVEERLVLIKGYLESGDSQITIKRALEEARNSLAFIKQQNYAEVDIKTRTELSHARQTMFSLKNLLYDQSIANNLQKKLFSIETKVNDILNFINKLMTDTREAMKINQIHQQKLNNVEKNCKITQEKKKSSIISLTKGNGYLQAANINLKTLRQNDILYFNNEMMKKISEVHYIYNREIEPTEKVTECNIHSKFISAKANEYSSLFGSRFKKGSEETLVAANVYHKILSSIHKASENSMNAQKIGLEANLSAKQKNLNELDLYAKADIRRVFSHDLRQEADGLRQNANDMQIQIDELILRSKTYFLTVRKKFDDLILYKRNLGSLQIVSILAEEAVRQSTVALKESQRTNEKISQQLKQKHHDIRPKIEEMLCFSAEKLSNVANKVNEANKNMQKVEKQAIYLTRRKTNVEEYVRQVQKQIENFKKRAIYARQIADGVKLPVTSKSTLEKCSRSFRVKLPSSNYNKIQIVYAAFESDPKNALLIHIYGSAEQKNQNFLSLELVQQKIRFSWSIQNITMSIMHEKTIEAKKSQGKDGFLYEITAERIGFLGRLNVRKLEDSFTESDFNQWRVNKSSILKSAFALNLQKNDLTTFGKSYAQLYTEGFSGTLYSIKINEKNIGLWNYAENDGCIESYPILSHENLFAEHSCFTFNGEGYAMQENLRNYDFRYLSISLEFRSFDQSSLLFYAVNKIKKQHLLLELREGRLFMEVKYGAEKRMSFLTKKRFNSGKWVLLESARAYRNNVETGVLRVVQDDINEDLIDTITLNKREFLDMTRCLIFVGGMPFTSSPEDMEFFKLRKFDSFLGQMKAITISNPGSNTIMNPLYTERFKKNYNFGVVASCQNPIASVSSFSGNGFLEIELQGLQDFFGFCFQTQAKDCLLALILSNENKTGNFISFSIVQENFHIEMSQEGSKKLNFTSNNLPNDGLQHCFSIVQQQNRFLMYIDGELISKMRAYELLDAGKKPKMYLGGAPVDIKRKIVPFLQSNFVGTIRDVVYINENDAQIIDMKKHTSMQNVFIGRDLYFFDEK